VNKTILIVGSLLITVIFFGAFYLLVQTRQTELASVSVDTQQQSTTTTTVKVPTSGLTTKILNDVKKEALSVQLLERGTIVNFDQTKQLLTLLTYDPTKQKTEQLIEISTKDLVRTACWPATQQAGDITIDVRNSFFELTPASSLSLTNETFVDSPQFTDYLNKFAFIKLKTTSVTTPLLAEQIAILDC
jgi:preprotein translocase subunit YajC